MDIHVPLRSTGHPLLVCRRSSAPVKKEARRFVKERKWELANSHRQKRQKIRLTSPRSKVQYNALERNLEGEASSGRPPALELQRRYAQATPVR